MKIRIRGEVVYRVMVDETVEISNFDLEESDDRGTFSREIMHEIADQAAFQDLESGGVADFDVYAEEVTS